MVSHQFGWRPAVDGFLLHCVLPGALLGEDHGHPTGYAWCEQQAYLADGARTNWDMWNAHDACVPGYERFVILKALGVGPVEGMSLRQVREAAPSADAVADERLLELAYEGFVVRPGPDYLWQLAKTGATRWYDRRRP